MQFCPLLRIAGTENSALERRRFPTWFLPPAALGAGGELRARGAAFPHVQTRREALRELAERLLFITWAGLITGWHAFIIGLGYKMDRGWRMGSAVETGLGLNVFFVSLCPGPRPAGPKAAVTAAGGRAPGQARPGRRPRDTTEAAARGPRRDKMAATSSNDLLSRRGTAPSAALYGLGGRADSCDRLPSVPSSPLLPLPSTCWHYLPVLVGSEASVCSSSQ